MQQQELRVPHYVERALTRLRSGKVLVRQCSSSEEAIEKGDGHLFFTHPDGRPIGTATGNFLIKNRLVEPVGDALFAEDSQSYRLSGNAA